ncbi:hypothetical protein CS627_14220 [Salmonella enterica]|nr:hypothetical protein [Salmonella enterica]ECT9529770.1 hypothetical protein [Salmonella enterica subsp. enterica serovar Richmond]EBK3351738.1 hypothetical protein [Salmonella enterica]EBK7091987.1 hypothetical protein [Salmonella enterica]EBM1375302.1 hypothetical protein [Salmonella enterica]
MGHLFLVELAGANNHFHGKSSPRNLASTPFSCADANVLLLLNLPPNQALNHKAEFTITLAYD